MLVDTPRSLGNWIRLSAATAKAKAKAKAKVYLTLSIPRCLVLAKPAMVLTQAKTSSMRLRACGRRITVAADKGYDTADFVMKLRDPGATPHVAQFTSGRRSAIAARTNRHEGYQARQLIWDLRGFVAKIGPFRWREETLPPNGAS